MQKILNKKKISKIDTKTMVYIGRPYNNSNEHFGNPFSHIPSSKASVILKTRNESILACKNWLNGVEYKDIEPERRLWILNNLHLLKNKDLVCWCSPLSCHGEIYIELLEKENNNVN